MGLEYLYLFALGALSIFGPCSLVMLPIVVTRYTHKFRQLLCFLIGIYLVFLTLGIITILTGKLLSSFIGDYLFVFAGIITFISGLQLLGAINFYVPMISFGKNFNTNFMSGIVFGFVSLTCIGPTLSAALSIIIISSNMFTGIMAITMFSIGHLIPYIILGKIITNPKINQIILDHAKIARKISGFILLLVSIYLLYFGLRGFFI